MARAPLGQTQSRGNTTDPRIPFPPMGLRPRHRFAALMLTKAAALTF